MTATKNQLILAHANNRTIAINSAWEVLVQFVDFYKDIH